MSDYLRITRGDQRTATITADDDLTGVPLTFTAKVNPWDADAVFTKTSGDGIEVGSPTTTAVITFLAADTEDLDPIVLHWDLQAEVDGEPVTIADGRLAVRQDITP